MSYITYMKLGLFVICHLQTCNNLLKQLATSLLITSYDNQLATSLLTTCNRLVVKKLLQAVRTTGAPSSRFDEFILLIWLLNYQNKISQIYFEDLFVYAKISVFCSLLLFFFFTKAGENVPKRCVMN